MHGLKDRPRDAIGNPRAGSLCRTHAPRTAIGGGFALHRRPATSQRAGPACRGSAKATMAAAPSSRRKAPDIPPAPSPRPATRSAPPSRIVVPNPCAANRHWRWFRLAPAACSRPAGRTGLSGIREGHHGCGAQQPAWGTSHSASPYPRPPARQASRRPAGREFDQSISTPAGAARTVSSFAAPGCRSETPGAPPWPFRPRRHVESVGNNLPEPAPSCLSGMKTAVSWECSPSFPHRISKRKARTATHLTTAKF